MYRRLAAILGLVLLASSCKIQRTPREYIDRRDPAVTEFQVAEEEVRNRITLLETALNQRDSEAALRVLDPAAEVFVIGPRAEEYFRGDHQITTLVEILTELDPLRVSLRDVHVQVGPRAAVAWFATQVEVQPRQGVEAQSPHLRLTGVYVQREGRWELAQAHLSLPADPLTAPVPAEGYPPAPPPAAGAG